MSVTSVRGTAAGFELIFTRVADTDRWDAEIPVGTADGCYYVEVYAVDDAGNTASWCGILTVEAGRAARLELWPTERAYWYGVRDLSSSVCQSDGVSAAKADDGILAVPRRDGCFADVRDGVTSFLPPPTPEHVKFPDRALSMLKKYSEVI